tara:strand:- start:292 stop:426 length:135 start_codon:yes stop_codon:yes gene_type:complete
MNLEQTPNGLKITDIIGNQLISRLYIGYSKKESIKLFKQYKKQL